MPKVLRREFFGVGSADEFRIWPLSCLHIGAADCDEKRIERVVKEIAEDERSYWLGLGDYLDAINRSDKRFDVEDLAPWISRNDMRDILRAQLRRFYDVIQPIAHKCLGAAIGNHEKTIYKYYERDVGDDIVTFLKNEGGFADDYPLGLGYAGWVLFSFFKSKRRNGGSRMVRTYAHHGFGGGKRTSSTITSMENWLYAHEADVLFFGHTHKWGSTKITVEGVSDKGHRPTTRDRFGVAASTFKGRVDVENVGYGIEKGYNPTAIGNQYVTLRPHAPDGWRSIETTGW